jgi:hypothetical protein
MPRAESRRKKHGISISKANKQKNDTIFAQIELGGSFKSRKETKGKSIGKWKNTELSKG